MRCCGSGPLTAVAVFLFAGLAFAPVSDWTAPPECADVDAVFAAAEAFGAEVEQAFLTLEGRIEAVEGGYRLDLEIETPSGTTTRQLHAGSCAELTRAAGLVLSVAVDPLRVPDPPAEIAPVDNEPTEAPTPASTPVARVDAVPTRNVPADAESGVDRLPLRASAVVGGTLGRGLVPAVDGRVQLGLALDAPWIRAELLGFHAFAQTVEYRDPIGVGATIQAWGGSARVGPRGALGLVELACPAGVEVAAVSGIGFGVTRSWRRADLAWSAVVAPGLRLPLGNRVSVGVDAELSVAIRRPAFTVDQRDELYRIPRLGARGGARLEVRFFGSARDQIPAQRRPR